jgi:hypothetical protein
VPPISGPLVGFNPVTVGGERSLLDSIRSIRGRHAVDRVRRSLDRKANGRMTMLITSKDGQSTKRNVD